MRVIDYFCIQNLNMANGVENMKKELALEYNRLYSDACTIIEEARTQAYKAVNVALTLRNWKLGERIAKEELDGAKRAEYGKYVVATLAKDLSAKYGKGLDRKSLYNYLSFFRFYPKIVDAVSRQSGKVDAVGRQFGKVAAMRPQLLPWTHYRELIRVDNPDARAWYEQEALQEGWSTRTLHRNIASQYYFRLLKSQHQENVREEMHQLTTAYEQDKLVFIKNPVVAEFLGLQTDLDYTETKLESSIISHMQKFIMEMGKGFAFVARQQHIRTDMGDYYIDLVFYNYILKCFFLIDLKTTQISHQDVGQMDMYVRMYDELKRSEGDNPTIGLLLCSETSEDMARYSVLNSSSQLFQAKYLTYLPTQEELRREIERQKAVYELQNKEDDGLQNV